MIRRLNGVPHFIYLRQAARVPPDLLMKCGVSRADADRILKSKLPQAIRVEKTEEAAAEAVAGLRTHGLEAFAVTPETLREFAPGPVKSWPPAIDGVRMIVLGKIHRESRTVTSSRVDPIAGAAIGYAAAGAPLAAGRLADRESMSVSKGEESFCCLIANPREAVALMEVGFDYKGALDRVELRREKSFLKVVEKARASWPDARFDDRLYRYPASIRLLGAGVSVSTGRLVTVTRQTQAGSTEARAWAITYLLYLESFGEKGASPSSR